jgi:hypothetical protein
MPCQPSIEPAHATRERTQADADCKTTWRGPAGRGPAPPVHGVFSLLVSNR